MCGRGGRAGTDGQVKPGEMIQTMEKVGVVLKFPKTWGSGKDLFCSSGQSVKY